MKKKIFLMLAVMAMLVCVFAITASAKEAYLEEIPDNLLFSDDTVTHFIVFDDEKYYTGSGSTLNGLNVENIESSLASLGITKDMIGGNKTYLTKFVFPAYLNGTLLAYIDVNSSIKSNTYFSNVCGYVSFPGTMTKTHDMNQKVEQLRGIDFGENSQLTAIPGCFANSAKKLKEVKNFPTAKLESIGYDAFNGATQAFSGELYINAKNVDHGAFNNATTYVTSLVFGENLTFLGTQSFSIRKGETGLCDPLLERIEFKSNVANINSESYGPFYFALGSSSRSEYTSLKCIVLSNEANKNAIANGATIFNDIAPNSYIRFLYDESKEFVHSSHKINYENATISYESFFENGTLTGYCTRCNKAESESTAPLFTCLGFSTPTEYGKKGLALGFEVNEEALSAYKATGKTLAFGAYVAGCENVMNDNVTDMYNYAKAIKADVTIEDVSYYAMKVTGFSTEEQMNAKLCLGAYVVENGEVSYLQAGEAVDGCNFLYTTYNLAYANSSNK